MTQSTTSKQVRLTYQEPQLVSNRAAVLLHGSTEAERQAWAHEAAAAFDHEGSLEELREVEEKALVALLNKSRGVVYVADASKLPWDSQRELARTLREKEERPKWILGLGTAPDSAVTRGLLRDDLAYALRRGTVDLGSPEVKSVLKKRRAKAKKR